MLVKKIIILFITYHTQYKAYKMQAEAYFTLDIIIGTLYIVL
jgi:hypothetical protein